MLFSIKCGNVQGVDPDQARLVYLVSSTEAMYEARLECVTDGNAAVYITEFDDDPASMATHVDWAIMRERTGPIRSRTATAVWARVAVDDALGGEARGCRDSGPCR